MKQVLARTSILLIGVVTLTTPIATVELARRDVGYDARFRAVTLSISHGLIISFDIKHPELSKGYWYLIPWRKTKLEM
jgi:hypothetical protein